MKNQLIGQGTVVSLAINGSVVKEVQFNLKGPAGDDHSKMFRVLSGHDGVYTKTSKLGKGDIVFNWRTWTGLSSAEIVEVERELGVKIPRGCLLENIVVAGIPKFSKLPPTSRLVFPQRDRSQVILAVWEENSPCAGVGQRLQECYQMQHLCTRFIAAAQHKRGVMGFVLSEGVVRVGDIVLVYPPAQ